MRKNAYSIIAYLAIAAAGFLSIFTIPFREPVAPAETIPEHEVTIDEVIEKEKEDIAERKLYLDSLLESAELARIAEIRATETETETETESWHNLSLEEETSEIEPISQSETETEAETETTEKIYKPVSSMMAPDLQAWVYAYSMQQAIDPFVVMAICERESGCISNIMGDQGKAYGIMQIQIRWVPDKLSAHGYTAQDMLQAQPNIVIGIEILKDYLRTGNGLEWALMAYNGGVPSVGSPSTREYASWVLARAAELRSEAE